VDRQLARARRAMNLQPPAMNLQSLPPSSGGDEQMFGAE